LGCWCSSTRPRGATWRAASPGSRSSRSRPEASRAKRGRWRPSCRRARRNALGASPTGNRPVRPRRPRIAGTRRRYRIHRAQDHGARPPWPRCLGRRDGAHPAAERGWRFAARRRFQSNSLDTPTRSWHSRRRAATRRPVNAALAYLVSAQGTDGAFGHQRSSLHLHRGLRRCMAFNAFSQDHSLTLPGAGGQGLARRQAIRGPLMRRLSRTPWRRSRSRCATTDAATFSAAQAALRAAQQAMGSWSADPYLTAIALRALAAYGHRATSRDHGAVEAIVVVPRANAPLPGALAQATGPRSERELERLRRHSPGGLGAGRLHRAGDEGGDMRRSRRNVHRLGGRLDQSRNDFAPVASSTATLRGTVRDGANGQPLAGVSVAVGAAPHSRRPMERMRSPASRRARFPSASPSRDTRRSTRRRRFPRDRCSCSASLYTGQAPTDATVTAR
jgi:hypothetical protein